MYTYLSVLICNDYDKGTDNFLFSSQEYFRFVFQHFVNDRKVSPVISGTFSPSSQADDQTVKLKDFE